MDSQLFCVDVSSSTKMSYAGRMNLGPTFTGTGGSREPYVPHCVLLYSFGVIGIKIEIEIGIRIQIGVEIEIGIGRGIVIDISIEIGIATGIETGVGIGLGHIT